MAYSDFIKSRLRYWRISPDAKRGLIEYCGRLEERNLPVILDLHHIAWHTGIPAASLAGMIDRPQRYYREFDLPKRSGGRREVAVPTPQLAHVQRWMLEAILNRLPLGEPVHGFRTGRSIVSNARVHLGQPQLLKLDIRNFFGSVTRSQVEDIYLDAGYSPKVSYFLSRLSTLFGRLPQGAPSSPAIANVALSAFDLAIETLCRQLGLTYTRYADDLAISGKDIRRGLITQIKLELEAAGFELEEKKTRLVSGGQKKIVTGISIGSGTLKLPRDRRRRLRQIVHLLAANGLAEHLKSRGIRDPIYRFRLAGELGFWLQIEPNNPVARKGMALLSAYSRQ